MRTNYSMSKVGRIIFSSLTLLGCLLTSCSTKRASNKVQWSKWFDNGDGTHTRHDLNELTREETEPHTFELSNYIVEPTEVAPGKAMYLCDKCGAKEERTVKPTGNYVFNQEVVDSKYLYKKCSEHSAIYYKSSVEGAYGNPEELFEHSDIPEGYSEVEYIKSDGRQHIDTGVANTSNNVVSINDEKVKPLPSGYQRLEYIESTGTQFIDTGYRFHSGFDGLEIKFQATSLDQYGMIFASGMYQDKNHTWLYHYKDANQIGFYIYANNGQECPAYTTIDLNIHTFKYMNQEAYFDGAKRGSTKRSGLATSNATLFSYNGADYSYYGRIYSCKIYKENVLVRNLVPATRNVTGQNGMFDLVDERFFPNLGTGNFVAGNIMDQGGSLLPSSYQEVEYLETTGTQYIDTGIHKPEALETDVFKIEADVTLADNPNGTRLFLFGFDNPHYNHYAEVNGDGHYGGYAAYASGTIVANNKYTFGMTINGGSNTEYFTNGERTSTTSEYRSATWGSFVLFRLNEEYPGNLTRIHKVKIWMNEVLVRNYVPAIRSSDNKAGMYDLVNDEFYINSDAGDDFLTGNPVNHDANLKLPSDYQEVEYIEANNGQYINTGFADTPNTKVSVDVQMTSTTPTQQRLFGHGFDEDLGENCVSFEVYINSVGQWSRATSDGPGNWQQSGVDADLERHTYILDNNSFEILTDDVSIYNGENTSHITRQNNLPITLLRRINTEGIAFQLPATRAKLFGCKIWDNNVLVRDFVPCYRKTDDVGGLYDLVTREFYSNAADNENFIVGNPINISPLQRLPNDYQEIEYLESDGTQYIDTGFHATNYTCIETKCNVLGPYSVYGTTRSYNYTAGINVPGGYFYYWNRESGGPAAPTNATGIQIVKQDNNSCYRNGELVHTYDEEVFTDPFSLYLFARNYDNQPNDAGNIRIYYLTISENNASVHNFIPCYRKSNGEGGMYDLVNETFYANSGTGEFICGRDIDFVSGEPRLPSGFTELEYIESSGEQWIDSGLNTGDNITKIESDYYKTVDTNRQILFGACTPGATYYSYFGYCEGDNTNDIVWGRTNISCGVPMTIGEYNATLTLNGLNFSYDINGHVTTGECIDAPKGDTNYYLFADNSEGNPIYNFICRLFTFKVWVNGDLERDYVPCYSSSARCNGLFDLVSGTFFVSQTGVDFVAGPEKNPGSLQNLDRNYNICQKAEIPPYYYQLNYIESNGRQLLDTKVLGNATLEITMKLMKSQNPQGFGYDAAVGECYGSDQTNKYVATTTSIGGIDNLKIDFGESIEGIEHVTINGEDGPSFSLGDIAKKSLKLFGMDEVHMSKALVYSAKVKQNGVVVRDFVPVMIKDTMECGLYDLVTNRFYGSETEHGFVRGGTPFENINTQNINVFCNRGDDGFKARENKITSYRIYDSKQVVRDFVPVIRNSDSKPGLYDLVTKKFYTASSEYELEAGPLVSHVLDEGRVTKQATYNEEGEIIYKCSICGAEIHKKTETTAYKVTFIPSNSELTAVKIFESNDPSKYSSSLEGYSRNQNTFNYSKHNATIWFEIPGEGSKEYEIITTSGIVEKLKDGRYQISGIKGDTYVRIVEKT